MHTVLYAIMWVLERELGSLEEHQVLVIAEPSLQPLDFSYFECSLAIAPVKWLDKVFCRNFNLFLLVHFVHAAGDFIPGTSYMVGNSATDLYCHSAYWLISLMCD